MADPYEVLGLSRTAKQDEIRKAYRRLAKKNHPDLHPGDKAAEARFKEIATAYGIVGDEKKRARFDNGDIDASGTEVPQPQEREFYRQHAEAQSGSRYGSQWNGPGQTESDLFAELFGAQGRRADMRGADVNYTLAIDFLEAINGAKKRVVMADGRTLDITIPAGLKDGQTLRLRGQGQPGLGSGPPGDTLVEIHVRSHPVFRRDGRDIRSDLPITLGEAMAGAKVPVETVSGSVSLGIPKGSNTGTILRLRGRGVPASTGTGDHFVELKVVLPASPDNAFVEVVTAWEAAHPYDPRKAVGAQP
jgi:DnaJ-class molecular chaperone